MSDDDPRAGAVSAEARGRGLSEPMSDALLDEITEAYCDANMKCDDDTGLYDVRPGCEARRSASRAWLTVTAVGLLIEEVHRLRAALAVTGATGDGEGADVG